MIEGSDQDQTVVLVDLHGEITATAVHDRGHIVAHISASAISNRCRRVRLWGNDCQDTLTIPLSVPLGDRILVDDTTSRQVNVIVRDS